METQKVDVLRYLSDAEICHQLHPPCLLPASCFVFFWCCEVRDTDHSNWRVARDGPDLEFARQNYPPIFASAEPVDSNLSSEVAESQQILPLTRGSEALLLLVIDDQVRWVTRRFSVLQCEALAELSSSNKLSRFIINSSAKIYSIALVS
jgi:hypothetical protein